MFINRPCFFCQCQGGSTIAFNRGTSEKTSAVWPTKPGTWSVGRRWTSPPSIMVPVVFLFLLAWNLRLFCPDLKTFLPPSSFAVQFLSPLATVLTHDTSLILNYGYETPKQVILPLKFAYGIIPRRFAPGIVRPANLSALRFWNLGLTKVIVPF